MGRKPDKLSKPDKLVVNTKKIEKPSRSEDEKHLKATRRKNKLFTMNGDAIYEKDADNFNQNASASEQPKDISNAYEKALLSAISDASADPNTSIFMDQQQGVKKIERDGNLWKVIDGNGNTFCAEKVVLGPEVGRIEKNVSIGKMLELKIVSSETFIQAHDRLDQLARAKLRGLIQRSKPRIIFSGEQRAAGANFLAQGEGYGVILTGISKDEEKQLYRYMPYSIAKLAAIATLKDLKQLSGKDKVTFRNSINQLDPTFRVEAAEHMSPEEEAKNEAARKFLREYIHPNVIADLEKGPIDLAYGLPPGGKVFNSYVKSAEINDGGVKVTLLDGKVIQGNILVLDKENSAVDVLDKQDLEDLVPYLKDRNVVGIQTRDGSMKILDTTPDPRLPFHVNKILLRLSGLLLVKAKL